MESNTEERLYNLEITVEGIKKETAGIIRDVQQLQQMMKLMGGGTNNQEGGSEGGNSGEIQRNWRKTVNLPGFEGQEPHIWIDRAERFFDIQKIAEEDKIELASLSMEGSASHWFKIWKDKTKNGSWPELKAALINRFAGEFRGTVYEQLAMLRQEGSVEEFIRNFERLLGQTQGLSEELALGFFLAGLREQIKGQVRIQDPKKLELAIRIARDVEDAVIREWGQNY